MLKENYLIQDFEMMTDHLEILIKVPAKIHECVLTGNFVHIPKLIVELEQSTKVLEALNTKKLKRGLIERNNFLYPTDWGKRNE